MNSICWPVFTGITFDFLIIATPIISILFLVKIILSFRIIIITAYTRPPFWPMWPCRRRSLVLYGLWGFCAIDLLVFCYCILTLFFEFFVFVNVFSTFLNSMTLFPYRYSQSTLPIILRRRPQIVASTLAFKTTWCVIWAWWPFIFAVFKLFDSGFG